MADNISNLIDESVFKEIDKLIVDLGKANTTMQTLVASGAEFVINPQTINSLQQFNTILGKLTGTQNELVVATNNVVSVNEKLDAVTQAQGKDVNTLLDYYAQLKLKIYENNGLMAQYSRSIDDAAQGLKSVSNAASGVKEQLGAGYTNTINNSKKSIEDLIKANKLLGDEVTATNKLIKQTAAEAAAAQELEISKMIAAQEKLTAKQDAELDKQAQNVVKNELIKLEAEEKAIAQMIALNQKRVAELDADEEKIKQSVLKNELQKAEARQLAFDKAWIDGEKWQAQQARIQEKAQKTNNVFTQFGNIFERMGLRMVASFILWQVGIGLLQSLWEWFNKDAKAAKEYADALKEVDDSVAASALGDKQKAQQLIAIARDQNTAMHLRIDAVKDLQELYPNYFKNLTQEQILTGNITKATDELTKALYNKAMMEANYDKAKLAAKKQSELQDQLDQAEERRKNLAGGTLNPVTGQTYSLIKQGDERLAQIRAEMAKVQAEIDRYNNRGNDFAVKAAGVLVQDPKDKKGRVHSDYEIKKKAIEADYKLVKDLETANKDGQKATMDDETKSLQERLLANSRFQAAELALAANEYDKERKLNNLDVKYKKETAATQKTNMDAALIAEYKSAESITMTGLKRIQTLADEANEKWVKSEEEKFAEQKDMEMAGLIVSEQVQKDLYDKKLINAEQYNKNVTSIRNKELILANEIEQAHDRVMLSSGKLTEGERTRYEKRVAQLEKELAALKGKKIDEKNPRPTGAFPELEAGFDSLNEKKDLQHRLEAISHFAAQAGEIYENLYSSIRQIRDNAFAKEQMQLEIEMRTVELQSKQKIDAINASTGYEITKENQASKVVAQTTAQENKIQQEQNHLAIKKAVADKQAAEAGVILNTSLAIAKTLPMFSNPATAAIGAAEVALITALGAAQYAAAASTPIPQYEFGTVSHTGGLFVAGEAGEREYVKAPGKPGYWTSNVAAVYNEPAGTSVTPEHNLIEYAMNNAAGAVFAIQQDRSNERLLNELTDKIAEKFEDVGEGIAMAVIRSKTSISIYNRGKNDHLTYKHGRN